MNKMTFEEYAEDFISKLNDAMLNDINGMFPLDIISELQIIMKEEYEKYLKTLA